MQYIVVSTPRKLGIFDAQTKNFEVEVNKKIMDGWRPIGGIAIDDSGFHQALTKE